MVQQQVSVGQVAGGFSGPPVANGQQVGPLDSSSLAMPALVSGQQNSQQAQGNLNSSNTNSPQSQYSPQASLYQQQLIKSAQQFVAQQQPRLNGLNGAPAPSNNQQLMNRQFPTANGESHFNQQQQQEGPYGSNSNNLQQQQIPGRPAPIFAPKPNFYGQIAQQQQIQSNAQSQMYASGRQQLAQMQAGPNYYQQHSPASNQQVQQPISLSLRPNTSQQMALFAQGQSAAGLSPAQQQQQQMLEQQQRQMQQLVMSYQDQMQLAQQQQNSFALQQQQQSQQSQMHQEARLVGGQLGGRQAVEVPPGRVPSGAWPASQQELEQQQLRGPPSLAQVLQPAVARQLAGGILNANAREQVQMPPAGHRAGRLAGAFSDRDSVSTLSRFNQFDERRSFTMRSQYTAQAAHSKQGGQFGFVELTGEALRRLLGFGPEPSRRLVSQREPLLSAGEQLQRNLTSASHQTQADQKQQHKLPANPSSTSVTIIDSGEDQHFKRRVFQYQLAIVRLLNFLMSVLVLLSPVAMLLIPKMEPLLHAGPQDLSLEYNSQEPPPSSTGVVSHALGLATGQKSLKGPNLAQQQQNQWRISECQSSDCDGPLIGFVIRLLMLAIAQWAIFFRAQTATLPRVDFQRCFLISLAVLVTSAYWLFFVFRVFDKRHNEFELHYMTIVQFATSMLETLILLHYLALVLLEMRHRKKVFCLKVVRSPDGESKFYSCGTLSVQKCAQFVLEKYQRDFTHFGSYREQLLGLEDELAQVLKRQREARHDSSAGEQATRRHRTSSPRAHSNADEPGDSHEDEHDEQTTGRASSRRSRRHHHQRRHHSGSRHSRANQDEPGEEGHERGRRSPSRSPARSVRTRDRPAGKRDSKVRDERPSGDEQDEERANRNNESSAEQSSDATSKMKESSLETVRPADEQGQLASTSSGVGAAKVDLEISEQPRHQPSGRTANRADELESVRSARSRRSTGSRMHHRREHADPSRRHSSTRRNEAQRERSSSRARGHHATTTNAELELGERSSSHIVDQLEEHERKLRRRKLRLLAAVEDSFEQIKLLDPEAGQPKNQTTELNGGPVPLARPTAASGMDAGQAARNLYPNIARSLQKYLRLTKQTGRHNLQSIYEHLSKCLLYKLGARTFLEKFTNLDPVWQQSETSLFANCRLAEGHSAGEHQRFLSKRKDELEINSWSLICDDFLSRQIDSGTFFVLKQGQVSLLVTVAKLPHLSLSEQVLDPGQCKFTIGPNPETSSV